MSDLDFGASDRLAKGAEAVDRAVELDGSADAAAFEDAATRAVAHLAIAAVAALVSIADSLRRIAQHGGPPR